MNREEGRARAPSAETPGAPPTLGAGRNEESWGEFGLESLGRMRATSTWGTTARLRRIARTPEILKGGGLGPRTHWPPSAAATDKFLEPESADPSVRRSIPRRDPLNRSGSRLRELTDRSLRQALAETTSAVVEVDPQVADAREPAFALFHPRFAPSVAGRRQGHREGDRGENTNPTTDHRPRAGLRSEPALVAPHVPRAERIGIALGNGYAPGGWVDLFSGTGSLL